MRKDSTPQVQTREIADSELDTVSGGILGPVLDTVWSVDSSLPSVSDVAGLATSATGLNVAPLTGLAGL
ncbi:type A2 lantipeptide [Actinacidiphila epipremni]|uniref:Type A2 lantipeptide n=1 Tax=Actinacidiphila epipremni TaxID=2053013 RepID=A0ABX0ZTG9_9ACTN|nr:type A2 lantipeptide [Actinacidiphila epipremni]NJP47299.1 type A2 lantipeptide [Actinacidiphila epipremni]